jgi:hypothetical protein
MPMTPMQLATMLNSTEVMPGNVTPETWGAPYTPVGDVIKGPWGNQSVESGIPIVPGMPGAAPGAMSPPPMTMGRSTQRAIEQSPNVSVMPAPGRMPSARDSAQSSFQSDPAAMARMLKGGIDPSIPRVPMSQQGSSLEQLRPDVMKQQAQNAGIMQWAKGMGLDLAKIEKALPLMRQTFGNDQAIKYFLATERQRMPSKD